MFKAGDVVRIKPRLFPDAGHAVRHPSRVDFVQNDGLVKTVYLSGSYKDIPTFWTAVSLEYAKDYYLDEFARQL